MKNWTDAEVVELNIAETAADRYTCANAPTCKKIANGNAYGACNNCKNYKSNNIVPTCEPTLAPNPTNEPDFDSPS